MSIAREDSEELFNWLVNAAGHGLSPPAGEFLKNLAEAGLWADSENYPILRPVLVVMAAKYPKYKVTDG